MAYTGDLKSPALGLVGSNPISDTKFINITDNMTFKIPHIVLRDPHPNGTEDRTDFDEIVQAYNDMHQKLKNGERVYIGFMEGERAGSIGYIHELFALECDVKAQVNTSFQRGYNGEDVHLSRLNAGFWITLAWDKRRNKLKEYVGRGMCYFPEYEGPTVWEKFDKKAAEEAALMKIKVKDRDGNKLSVGDSVIYINARYGGAAQLDRGTVSEIKMKIQKNRTKTSGTLNVKIDNENGEVSVITGPEKSVLKV